MRPPPPRPRPLALPAWTQFAIATALTGLIGAVTFWGSLVAFGKLEELPQIQEGLDRSPTATGSTSAWRLATLAVDLGRVQIRRRTCSSGCS